MAEPVSVPVPNKADAAWERLLELRVEARGLDIPGDIDHWPMDRLEREIAVRRNG